MASRERRGNTVEQRSNGHTPHRLAIEPLLPESCLSCRLPIAACRRWFRRSNRDYSRCHRCSHSSVRHRSTPESCPSRRRPIAACRRCPKDRKKIVWSAAGARIPVFAVDRLQNSATPANRPQPLAVAGREDRRKIVRSAAVPCLPVFPVGRR